MAAVLSLFVVGVLVGGLGVHVWHVRADGLPRVDRPVHGGDRDARGHERVIGQRLMDELELTAEQRTQVEAILEESRAEAEALRRDVGPRLREQLQRTHDRIVEVLTPDQRERFEALRRRHRPRAERFMLGGGHRH